MKTDIKHIFMAIAIGICLAGCKRAVSYRMCEGNIWHTAYHITYQSTNDMKDSIMSVLNGVELSLSTFNNASTISKINKSPEPMKCDALIAEVFKESQRINLLSNGAFDPTVGPLVDLWGFGHDRDSIRNVSQNTIDSLMSRIGLQECHIDEYGFLIKKHPATEFNFSAIAKGYACDKISEMFRRNHIDNYLIEIGGEIVMRGHNPKYDIWRIAIDAPFFISDNGEYQSAGTIAVSDCAVASSGNYRNYKEHEGKIIAHSINPISGKPIQNETLAVTVIAPECMTADALATACMVMPLESARTMIENLPEIDALFIVSDNDHISTIKTANFPEGAK